MDIINPKYITRPHPTRWRSPVAMGWAISLLIHAALAGAFLILSICREPAKFPNKPHVQTPTQTAFRDLEMAPVVSKLQMEAIPTDDSVPEYAGLPDLPNGSAAMGVGRSSAQNLGVMSDSGSGFTIPANPARKDDIYRSQFCGTAGTAQNLCYVVDCSGSMVMALDYVRSELRRAIGQLTPAQYFHMIFYAGGDPIELPPGRLIRASASNRQRALGFVDQMQLKTVADTSSAATAVVKAMERALTTTSAHHQQANLVYFLTDGQYNHAYVEEALRKMQSQRDRPAQINVISCGVRQNENFLRRLAMSYQGNYHFVSDEKMAEKQ